MSNKKNKYKLLVAITENEEYLKSLLDATKIPHTYISSNIKEIELKKLATYCHKSQVPKYILCSTDQLLLAHAQLLGLDTCFINNGLNDNMSYDSNYEVKVASPKKLLK